MRGKFNSNFEKGIGYVFEQSIVGLLGIMQRVRPIREAIQNPRRDSGSSCLHCSILQFCKMRFKGAAFQLTDVDFIAVAEEEK